MCLRCACVRQVGVGALIANKRWRDLEVPHEAKSNAARQSRAEPRSACLGCSRAPDRTDSFP